MSGRPILASPSGRWVIWLCPSMAGRDVMAGVAVVCVDVKDAG
jgi:hypothetical protein